MGPRIGDWSSDQNSRAFKGRKALMVFVEIDPSMHTSQKFVAPVKTLTYTGI